jgi:hypothetical protein
LVGEFMLSEGEGFAPLLDPAPKRHLGVHPSRLTASTDTLCSLLCYFPC